MIARGINFGNLGEPRRGDIIIGELQIIIFPY